MLVQLIAAALVAQAGPATVKADVNGDGVADIITGAGPGAGPMVTVADGKTGQQLRAFMAFDASFKGGVSVAAGDINGDGRADIIVGAGPGAAPHVKVFDGATGQLVRSWLAFEASFAGGVRVAAGDVNGDGRADISVTAGASRTGAKPHVKVFDGATGQLISSTLVPQRKQP